MCDYIVRGKEANCLASVGVRSENLELRKTFDNFYELCEIKIEKVYSFCRKAKATGMFFEHKKQPRWGRGNFVLTKTKLSVTDSYLH